MSWFGKVMGGTIGFMMGGPIGAMAGAALGHMAFDGENSEQGRGTSREQGEMVFFVSIFTSLGKIAKADGKITQEEIDFIEYFIKNQLKLSPKQREYAIAIVREAKHDNTPLSAYVKQFTQVFPQRDMRIMFYEVLFTAAMADGVLHPAEEAILREIPAYLLLQPNVFDNMKARFAGGGRKGSSASDLKAHYAVLECKPEMSDAEIKKAYRKKCREFHPDTLASQGLSKEFMDFAHQEIVKVNEAYEAIKKSRA